MDDRNIGLAHGNGGRKMRELIEAVFARQLGNPLLDLGADASALPAADGVLMVTTDGFTVQPLEFPGGDIGSLAVHGTVNDLAVSGATPLYITLNAFIEEGLDLALLQRLVTSLARAARESSVVVVAGDTKVVRRGEGSGLYLATTGIGIRPPQLRLGLHCILPGDSILVSGPVGDHGVAVLLAREQFGLDGDVRSDAASVLPLTRALSALPGLRFMRDPTRGGLATVLHDIAQADSLSVLVKEEAIPVRDSVRSLCDMLGYEPLYLACEGRVVAVVDPAQAEEALSRWRALPQGRDARIIGNVAAGQGRVLMETELGGWRPIEELEDDPLPRIC